MALTGSNQVGLESLRKQTEWFIANDKTTIVLIPESGTAVEQPSGGYDMGEAEPVPAQDFKVIGPFGDSNGRQETDGGIYHQTFDYILLGKHDCNVPVPSYWIDGGNRYRVFAKLIDNGYEKKFAVQSRGPEPNYG